MSNTSAAAAKPWFRSLDRSQRNTLLAANLGWLFDGFETYALFLTAGPALRSLLHADQHAQIPAYIGAVVAITLLGWGIGGLIGGMIADRIGRMRTLILAIMTYSVMTALTALSFEWVSFTILRFLVGISIGAQWATGSAMFAEWWPDRARGRAASIMQCGIAIGFFAASLVWLLVGQLGPDAWRYMFLICVAPALLTLFVRTAIPSTQPRLEADERRSAAYARHRSGEALTPDEESDLRFPIGDLFRQPKLRRRTLIVFLMSLATTLAWWAVASWVPTYAATLAAKAGLNEQLWAAYAGMAYNIGAVLGYIAFGFLADWFGRKPVTTLYFVMAFVMTPALFLWTQDLNVLLLAAGLNGFFTLGQYSWQAVWIAELFPARARATALAFAFNAPRLIASLGPMFTGVMIVQLGGYGQAAMVFACVYALGLLAALFLPETRGRPLPEAV